MTARRYAHRNAPLAKGTEMKAYAAWLGEYRNGMNVLIVLSAAQLVLVLFGAR